MFASQAAPDILAPAEFSQDVIAQREIDLPPLNQEQP
jgi:hypothetical protein